MQIQDTYLQEFLKSLVRIIVRASSQMRVTMCAIYYVSKHVLSLYRK